MAKSIQELLNLIEPFCLEYKIGKTEFGERACKNPNLLNDLRAGRAPTLTTVEKIVKFIEEYKRNRDRTMARFFLPQGDTGLHESKVGSVGRKGTRIVTQVKKRDEK